MSLKSSKYDVAILGSGLGGTMLASIFAKHGLSVALLESAVHPRFTIGESLIPETSVRLRILAEKHGIPELAWIGSFHTLRDNVSSACGVKRSFSFLYHREGEKWRAGEANQLPTLAPPFGPDSHLFRQDTDAWMASIAMQYGAELRQNTKVVDVEFDKEGATLQLEKGDPLRASYLIDAGGIGSLLARKFNLRDETPRFRTNSRALFTHMLGVKPADFVANKSEHGLPSPLGQSTMHHVFDGGWIWVIPFSNHRDSTNPLASIGVLLDRRKHPAATASPENEFRAIINRYPTIAEHFKNAYAVRPWIGSERIQFSQSSLKGERWIQLPHAACFIDPLFSSGLSVLTVAIDLMARDILNAFRENDFSPERFQQVEDVVMDGFDHYDHVIASSYDAFASYDTWNAWNRNWALGNYMGTFGPLADLVRYLGSNDRRWLDRTTNPDRIGVLSSHIPEIREAMLASGEDIAQVAKGEKTHSQASKDIFARLDALNFLPRFMGFGKAEHCSPSTFTLFRATRIVLWYRFFTNKRWRAYTDLSLITYARIAAGFMLDQLGTGLLRIRHDLRDVFFAGNKDWHHSPRALRAHKNWQSPTTKTPKHDAGEIVDSVWNKINK